MKRLAVLFFALMPLASAAQTVIQSTTYVSGLVVTVVDSTIAANTNVTIASGANVKFMATSGITLGPGVTISSGSTFRACLDSDGDGLGDDWEMQHFGNLTQTGSGDADGDGKSNLAEFLLGANPNSVAQVDSSTTTLIIHRPKQ